MKILILGNGFDLAHGLPTRYKDFLKFVEVVLADNSTLQDLKEQLKKLSKDRLKGITTVFAPDRIDEFHKKLKNNVWYYYLKKLGKIGENWSNIEEEISIIIKILENNHEVLYQDFSELSKSICKNIKIDEDKKKFNLFTESYIQRCKDTKRKLSDIKRLQERSFNDLKRFIRTFEIYLEDVIEPNIPKIRRLPFFDVNRFDYVISFNYTYTYEKIYGIDSTRICHVHGVCKDSKKSNIVIGIGDYASKKKGNSNFTIFKKTAQVLQNHNDMQYVSWQEAIEKNGDFVDVYIYGHSLDLADKYVLESFLDSEYTKVHIYCHTDTSQQRLVDNLNSLIGEDRVKEKSITNPSMIEFRSTGRGASA